MKKICLLTCVVATLMLSSSCSKKDNSDSQTSDQSDKKEVRASENITLYANVDSAFTISGNTYKVQAMQYDITEIATSQGDTLSRPVYSCVILVKDQLDKVLFKDSVMRDSWGYPGKFASIDSYILAFPILKSSENNIVFQFNVYEEEHEDSITGFISYDVLKKNFLYYWQESDFMEE